MYGTLSQSLYLWDLEEQKRRGPQKMGGGEWVAIFMEAGVDSSRHHDLAVQLVYQSYTYSVIFASLSSVAGQGLLCYVLWYKKSSVICFT